MDTHQASCGKGNRRLTRATSAAAISCFLIGAAAAHVIDGLHVEPVHRSLVPLVLQVLAIVGMSGGLVLFVKTRRLTLGLALMLVAAVVSIGASNVGAGL